jgi:predicted secreted Zn-dependent protease
VYKSFLEKEIQKATIRNKREKHTFTASIKAKAMSRAIQNLKRAESDKHKAQAKLAE